MSDSSLVEESNTRVETSWEYVGVRCRSVFNDYHLKGEKLLGVSGSQDDSLQTSPEICGDFGFDGVEGLILPRLMVLRLGQLEVYLDKRLLVILLRAELGFCRALK